MSLKSILSNNPLILNFFQQLHLKFYFTNPGLQHVASFLIASSQAAFSGKLCDIIHLSRSDKCRTSFGHFLSHGAWQPGFIWSYIQKFVSKNICDLSEENNAPWFAIYDNTIVVKSRPSSQAKNPTEAAASHFSHCKGKLALGKYQVRSLESIEKYLVTRVD